MPMTPAEEAALSLILGQRKGTGRHKVLLTEHQAAEIVAVNKHITREALVEAGFEIVPDDAAGDDMVLACLTVEPGKPLVRPDNDTAPCAWCGAMIQFRPSMSRVAVKVCTPCAQATQEPQS